MTRLNLVEAVAAFPVEQGVQRVGGAIDALVQVAELGEAGGTVAMVNWRGFTSSISSQVIGVDTVASGTPRTE